MYDRWARSCPLPGPLPLRQRSIRSKLPTRQHPCLLPNPRSLVAIPIRPASPTAAVRKVLCSVLAQRPEDSIMKSGRGPGHQRTARTPDSKAPRRGFRLRSALVRLANLHGVEAPGHASAGRIEGRACHDGLDGPKASLCARLAVSSTGWRRPNQGWHARIRTGLAQGGIAQGYTLIVCVPARAPPLGLGRSLTRPPTAIPPPPPSHRTQGRAGEHRLRRLGPARAASCWEAFSLPVLRATAHGNSTPSGGVKAARSIHHIVR